MRKLFLLSLVILMIVIFGCTKIDTGNVGDPVDIYIDKKPANVSEYKWAFKNKPIESRLDPRDFIPSDYAEAVSFIPDVPGNYEIMVVMVDDFNKEFDKKFKYKIVKATNFSDEYTEESQVDEAKDSTQIEKEIKTEKAQVTKNDWEEVPALTDKEKKSPRPKKEIQKRIDKDTKLYTIQFSSSHHKKYSEGAVNDLLKLGYDAYLEKFYLKNDPKPWYRVRVGTFSSFNDAKSVEMSLKNKTKQKGIWIDNK